NQTIVGADEGSDVLTVAVTSGGSTTTSSSPITVNPQAEQPIVTASTVPINEGQSSALTLTLDTASHNASDLFADGDDSVVITVTLSNGATLTQTGNGAAVTNNGDGTFTLTAHKVGDLTGLTITPTDEGTVTVDVSAVAHDGSSTSVGTASTTLTV